MKRVFVDTFYWIALVDTRDAWHQTARSMSLTLDNFQLVTSDSVLTEFVNYFSGYGPNTRRQVAIRAHRMLATGEIEIPAQTRAQFLAGLALYEARPDKNYSLTDCISMQMMRELGIFEILTHDHHFAQEGFVPILRNG